MADLVCIGVDKQFVGVEAVALGVHVRDKAGVGTLGPSGSKKASADPKITLIHRPSDTSCGQGPYRHRAGEGIRAAIGTERKAQHLSLARTRGSALTES
jgi:hypothetical protein